MILLSLLTAYYISEVIAGISHIADRTIIMYIPILALMYILSIVIQFLVYILYQSVEKESRVHLKKKVLKGVFDSFPNRIDESSKINEVLYSDINNITSFIFLSTDITASVISFTITGTLMFFINVYIAVTAIAIMLLTGLFSYLYSKKLKKIDFDLREKTDIHFKLIRDILRHIDHISISSSTKYHYKRYSSNVDDVKSIVVKRDRMTWIINLFSTATGYSWVIIFFFVGLQQLYSSNLTAASFVLLFSYSRIFNASFVSVLKSYSSSQQTLISLERVFSILNKNSQKSKCNLVEIVPSSIETVTFSDIYFKYDEQFVLEGFSKTVCHNLVLVTGKNGTGKTTLLNLISGLIKPQKGGIFFNDTSISEISYKNLQYSVSYFFQEDSLFDISVRDNILSFEGGECITMEELVFACKAVLILEDILALEKNFDTMLSEIKNFSFGQKKKMLIARAYLKPSKIVLFDEPLEGLDEISRNAIIELIRVVSKEKKVFVATHQPEYFPFCNSTISL